MQFMEALNDKTHRGSTQPTKVAGVRLITLVHRSDARGPLAILGQDSAQMPFNPVRIFFTYQANKHARGAHAHRICEQILICTSGHLRVLVNDGKTEEIFDLSGPERALHIGPMVWAEQFDHEPGSVLLVLTSHPYDEQDYIRDATTWRQELAP